jgi:hypothetical protein
MYVDDERQIRSFHSDQYKMTMNPIRSSTNYFLVDQHGAYHTSFIMLAGRWRQRRDN